MAELVDSFGRRFEYLRLSVTDQCNFRCMYCLPDGYRPPEGKREPELSREEIKNLVAGFARLGVWKIRLTGGEPTTRRDLLEVAGDIARTPGIERVAVSTNGGRLPVLAPGFRAAGVSAINISIDSLDRERFLRITGTDRLAEVLAGVDLALKQGFSSVKVNVVLLKDLNHDELERFTDWIRARPISVRFIELMRTGRNTELYKTHYLSGGHVQHHLRKSGWKEQERQAGDGPALVYRNPGYEGSMGIIAPYSPDFCSTCNRLRVTARGALKLCLFGENDHSLRPLLQSSQQLPELIDTIQRLVLRKPVSHFLHEGNYGNTWNLASIGG